MAAGIAGQIARRFPEAYEADLKTSRGYNLKLGQYSEVDTAHGKIFNLYTQFRPGMENPKVLASSIALAFQTLDIRHGGRPDFLLGIPLIGCGIAGGDWDHIKNVIDTFAPNLLICVVEYKP
jgi:O-acetyl-ADP-ribose deacetylase (regulator of RNase III)